MNEKLFEAINLLENTQIMIEYALQALSDNEEFFDNEYSEYLRYVAQTRENMAMYLLNTAWDGITEYEHKLKEESDHA